MKTLISNKKALFDYKVEKKIEAGIVLFGSEVKSIKSARANLQGSFLKFVEGEVYLVGLEVHKLATQSTNRIHNTKRDRKILLHKKQINELSQASRAVGFTVIPLEIIQNDKNLVKIIIALAKGLKKYDKRSKLREKDLKRSIEIDRKQYKI